MAERSPSAERARRLIALLPLLKRGRSVSLAELAARVGCSVEVVASDLATLTLCGVPPFTPADMIELSLERDRVTVHVEPPAIDRPLRFTPAEARALVAALQAAGWGPESPLARKLMANASASASLDEIERTVRAEAAPGGTAAVYATLARALDDRMKVRIEYLSGAHGTLSERVVCPWALVTRDGAWYLIGHCELAGEERVFRLDRIRSAHATDEPFEPPAHVRLDVAPHPETLPVAEVRFAPGAALPDLERWPGTAVEPQADGATVARVPYRSPAWLARWVAARLGEATVAGPAEVRQAVLELATRELERLRGEGA